MNGRCQKDALDRAEDICELCANQYCAQCLLFPRGHRNPPTCKTCALENSGIRGGSTKYAPISKREYKKLKKELIAQLEQVEEQEPAIEFFELKDPSQFDRSTELDRRPATVAPEEPKIDILKTESAPTQETVHPPAPETSTAMPTPPPPVVAPPPAPAPGDPVEPEPAFAPVDTSINPLALDWSARQSTPVPEEPPESEATTSAADLLARLKADQPIQSQFTSAPAELDIDPFATPAPAATPTSPPAPAVPAPLAPAAADPMPSQQRTAEEWTPPAPPPRGTNLAAKLAETTHGSTAPRSGASFAPAPAPVDVPAEAPPFNDPPAGSPPLDSSPFEPAPLASAPLDSSPFEPAPFHDDPIPAESAPKTMHIAPMQDGAFIDTPMQSPAVAAEPFAEHDVADESHPQRRKADTDNSGQWIPPTLRGMSASDERGPLPKRRN